MYVSSLHLYLPLIVRILTDFVHIFLFPGSQNAPWMNSLWQKLLSSTRSINCSIMTLCSGCSYDPCLLSLHHQALASKLAILHTSLTRSHRQNHLYRCFVQSEYGVLGAHNCVKIPDCIVSYIRLLSPREDGTYSLNFGKVVSGMDPKSQD